MRDHRQTADFAAPELPREKIKLTDRFITSRKAAAPAQRDDYHDSLVPGLSLRVTDRGHKSFVLHGRFPSNPNIFTRRNLGSFPVISLDDARNKARAWQKLIDRGIDPRAEEERQRLIETRQAAITFGAVAEAFIAEKLPSERKGREVARDIRRDLVSRLGKRPITEIQRIDIRDLIKWKKKTAPAQARNLLGYARRLFAWARDQEIYGLLASPCSEIRAREIIGERPVADRILSDDEIFALWRAACRLSYPYRQIYQLLVLNALRLNEVADASTPEFDFRKRDWTLPAVRMKGKRGKALSHLVPLTADSLLVIASIPNLADGPYLFSCNFGKSPVWVGSKIKKQIDAAMLRTLKALARKRGGDPTTVVLPPWVNHDVRRTVRTNLSPLKNSQGQRVADEVKEAVIAHKKPGMKGVYDKYAFADEKFEALELWADRLREIVDPRPSGHSAGNVIAYPRRA